MALLFVAIAVIILGVIIAILVYATIGLYEYRKERVLNDSSSTLLRACLYNLAVYTHVVLVSYLVLILTMTLTLGISDLLNTIKSAYWDIALLLVPLAVYIVLVELTRVLDIKEYCNEEIYAYIDRKDIDVIKEGYIKVKDIAYKLYKKDGYNTFLIDRDHISYLGYRYDNKYTYKVEVGIVSVEAPYANDKTTRVFLKPINGLYYKEA